MDSNKAQITIALLERALASGDEASEALAQWPDVTEKDPLLQASWHDLSHFVVDSDIRSRDPKYAEYQRRLLAGRINEIKEAYRLI
jgi:hypothetical protein